MLFSKVKSLVRAFADIASTFFDSLFNSFSTSTFFVSFEVVFLLIFFFLTSKFLFFTKLAISFLISQFPCDNVAAAFSAVNLLNSGAVIGYLQ